MFISIGQDCHPAGNLKALSLRNISLPFDWLLIPTILVFSYINDLINTQFQNFTTDLIYNYRQKVVSKNYKFIEFFHHDLIKNITLNRPDDENTNLVELMNKRAKKIMDIITNSDNEIVFICMLNHKKIFIEADINKLYNDMLEFDNNNNIKCKYKVLVYILNDNQDYELVLPTNLLKLKHFIFEKYINNTKINGDYGCKNDFEIMLKKHNFI